MIEFQKVYFSYKDGDSSIKDISFSIKPGECIILCGKSGSGKSTILRAVSGLAPVFYEGTLQGEIEVDKRIPAELACKVVWCCLSRSEKSIFYEYRSR